MLACSETFGNMSILTGITVYRWSFSIRHPRSHRSLERGGKLSAFATTEKLLMPSPLQANSCRAERLQHLHDLLPPNLAHPSRGEDAF